MEIANKVGVSEVLSRIVEGLKDDNEPYRRMVMETIEQVIQNLGAADVDTRLEEQLIDGILFAFQEQAREFLVAHTGWLVVHGTGRMGGCTGWDRTVVVLGGVTYGGVAGGREFVDADEIF